MSKTIFSINGEYFINENFSKLIYMPSESNMHNLYNGVECIYNEQCYSNFCKSINSNKNCDGKNCIRIKNGVCAPADNCDTNLSCPTNSTCVNHSCIDSTNKSVFRNNGSKGLYLTSGNEKPHNTLSDDNRKPQNTSNDNKISSSTTMPQKILSTESPKKPNSNKIIFIIIMFILFIGALLLIFRYYNDNKAT